MQNGKYSSNGKPNGNSGPAHTSQPDRRGYFVGARSIRIGPPMEIQLVQWTGFDDPSAKLKIAECDGQEPIEVAIRFDGEWEAFLNGENDFIDNIRGTKIFCDAAKKTIAVKNLPRGELKIQLSDTEIGRFFQLAKELDADRKVLVAERKAHIESEAAKEAAKVKARADAEAAKLAKTKADAEAAKKATEEAELNRLIAEEEAKKAAQAPPATEVKEVDDAVADEVPATVETPA